ncbi:hypothetical protein ABIB99_008997 [Bradyrhizobium sp. LA6.1]
MADNIPIDHVHEQSSRIAKQNEFMREIAAKAREILKTPIPDTFLGRKTREPRPKRMMSSREQSSGRASRSSETSELDAVVLSYRWTVLGIF